MKAIGKEISLTVKANSAGKTVVSTKESINKERRVDLASISWQTEMNTKVSGEIVNFMEKEHSKWQMAESIKAIGVKAKCMGEEFIVGLKDSNTKELTKTIWSKVLVLINGKMGQDTLETGFRTRETGKDI